MEQLLSVNVTKYDATTMYEGGSNTGLFCGELEDRRIVFAIFVISYVESSCDEKHEDG
ncbi:hypothetical protein [Halalkalibacter akibai]|uniref:Uncharacterized protein n=1 Tax=Halalkalibacter akibai (strain ATCC 43226 / DSM 21942 / CIP 109018 / JCM 9157 / 1139) TaxID=1236973 RepID=W4QSD5_HALA3|nr:hypothetical protein [Halalkalibacter akibai]GAE34996.1 hypothetical protein JCM9157_2087 [Halalkalibacter akibai JCM 9157]